MKLFFVKMEGCGNDYIYFDCFRQHIDNPEALSKRISDRHFGVGGDGIVLICPSKMADAEMRIFNADGSEAGMCGNAVRCVGKYIYESGLAVKSELSVGTLSGIKRLALSVENGVVSAVQVDMGAASFTPADLPVLLEGERVVGRKVSIGGKEYCITCVSMGNPHCVVFADDLMGIDLEKTGPEFENAPIFPNRVNTEFVRVIDERTLEMRVWERGSGETLACGTGACASVAAAVANGYCRKGEDILVKLRGGELVIRYTGETVTMSGPARRVFEGFIETEE